MRCTGYFRDAVHAMSCPCASKHCGGPIPVPLRARMSRPCRAREIVFESRLYGSRCAPLLVPGTGSFRDSAHRFFSQFSAQVTRVSKFQLLRSWERGSLSVRHRSKANLWNWQEYRTEARLASNVEGALSYICSRSLVAHATAGTSRQLAGIV